MVVKSSSVPGNLPYFEKPESFTKPLLCLDIDETLIASRQGHNPECDFHITLNINDFEQVYSILKRPGLDKFLLAIAVHYELAIFTYSIRAYADKIL